MSQFRALTLIVTLNIDAHCHPWHMRSLLPVDFDAHCHPWHRVIQYILYLKLNCKFLPATDTTAVGIGIAIALGHHILVMYALQGNAVTTC